MAIWDHQTDLESLDDHALFLRWCDEGGDHRASRRVAKLAAMAYADLETLRREKCWRERHQARDAFIYRGRRAASEESWELHKRSVRTALEVLDRATATLAFELDQAAECQEKTDRPMMTLPEAIRGISQVARVLPKLQPAAPEPDQTGKLDLSALSVDERLQFRDLLSRVTRKAT